MKTTKNVFLYTILVGLFAVPFIAFIVSNSMFFPFITGKGFTFRILVEVLGGLFVCLATIAPEYRPKMSAITKALLVFLGVIFIADIFSANAYKSFWSNYERMEGFVLLAHLFLYYIVASSILQTKSHWTKLWNTTIIASVIMSCYGVLQLAGKVPINQGGVRLDATFGNATYLAIYLVFHIFLCLYLLASVGIKKWQKWAYRLVAVFEFIILYYTATRGAILGLIGGLFLAGLLIVIKERENKKVRKAGASVLVAILVVVGLFFALRNTALVKKSAVLSRFDDLGVTELTGQARYFIWPMALKGVFQSPKTAVIGWGQESFNYVFNKYYNPQLFGQEEWFDRTHDIVLDWLVAGGILGFLAYASLFVALGYMLWRKQSPFTLWQKSILSGLVAAYIFHNLFVFDNLISYIIFFTLLAYVHTRSVQGQVEAVMHHKTLSEETVKYAILPITLIATVAIIYFVNVPAILANTTLIQAISPQPNSPQANLDLFKKVYSYHSFGDTEATEQLVTATSQIASMQTASADMKQQFYDFAKQKIEEKVAQTPHDARYLVFAGSFLNHFGKYSEAIPYLTRALAESPQKQSIIFELGSSYLGAGDQAKALQLFNQGYSLNLNSETARATYAIAAIYARNATILQQILPKINPDTILTDQRFLKAYADIGDYQSVIAILNGRLQKNPNDPQTMLSLASAYATAGNKAKAIALINEIISAHPEFKAQGEQYIQQVQKM